MELAIERFEVWLISLDSTVGSEVRKTRPCVVVSPNEMNRHIRTIIIAPLTTGGYAYPSRVDCELQDQKGQILLDQLRTVDKVRFIKGLGRIDASTQRLVLDGLARLFAP
jgi:mRNA interferase MazF